MSEEQEAIDAVTLPPEVPKKIEMTTMISSIFKGYGTEGSDEDKNIAKQDIREYLTQTVLELDGGADYNIVVLYDSSSMVKSDADSIYNAVTSFSHDNMASSYMGPNGITTGWYLPIKEELDLLFEAKVNGTVCDFFCDGTLL